MSKIHFIPHVHWDREWLRSTDSSRVKLVYYFDLLIDMLSHDQEMKYFTFDGQTAALEDYLAIKPYQREKISELVKNKQLFIGPWYVQPDMIMPSGEALLRNLFIGSKMASSLGHCMNVGWVPDAFGQNQITPYLFKEIGMKGIYAWRGFDYSSLHDSLFLWKGNGNTVMPSVHFALGYGYYRGFPEEYQKAKEDVDGFLPQLEERYKDGELLFMLGSDYAFPRRHTPQIIKQLQNDGYDCELNNPEDYLDILLEKAKQNGHQLDVYQGEARSAALGRIHAGITSTRIDIKNAMRHYETMMAKVVEPMIAISRFQGGYCDQELVNYFWKIIFKNQFHDSIYSSSPETVNQTVENRLLNLRHGLNELIWMSMRYISENADLSYLKEDEDILIMFNTLPYKRKDYAFVSMIVKDQDFVLKTKDGTIVPYEVISHQKETHHDIEFYNGIVNYHDSGEVLEGTKFKVQIKIDASILPPMGYEILTVCFGQKNNARISGNVLKTENGAENKYLKMIIEKDGTITVINKQTQETYTQLNTFLEKGDDGDEYNYSPCKDDQEIRINDIPPHIHCIEESAMEVKYRIEYETQVPEKVVDHKRVKETKTLKICSDVSLKSDSQTIDFETMIDNQSGDHIVRVSFDDIYSSQYSCSQDQLGTIVRPNIIAPQKPLEEGATEYVLPMYPMQRFVKLNHDYSIMSLISQGPFEYEIEKDQKICLTLLRSVGKFGKADLLIRPGRSSGYRMDVPSSQMINKQITSEYSVYFGTKDEMDQMIQAAEILNTPVMCRYLNQLKRKENQSLASSYQAISLDPRVELMALKKEEEGQGHVLRILNNRNHDIDHVELMIPKTMKCYECDTLENKKAELENCEGRVIIQNIMSNTFVNVIIE